MERCTGDQIKAFSFLSCTASDAKGTKEIKKKKKDLWEKSSFTMIMTW